MRHKLHLVMATKKIYKLSNTIFTTRVAHKKYRFMF